MQLVFVFGAQIEASFFPDEYPFSWPITQNPYSIHLFSSKTLENFSSPIHPSATS
ncbi:hypothetical protein Hanom_Chr01g00055541 [Helianthus anomalus]